MKDFFKLGVEEHQEGHDKEYIRDAGWWIVHRPVQWFFWLGFVLVIGVPLAIGNGIGIWREKRENKSRHRD